MIKLKDLFKHAALFTGIISLFLLNACKEDEVIEDPIASFQYEISDENFLQVAFSNYSLNAETYNWNFGDGNTSTEQNPVHTYEEIGNFEVILTATNSAGIVTNFAETIEIKDPFEALTRLAGQTSKTWKLYREGSSMGVGPSPDQPRIYWALENDGSRPCLYYQEFTFTRDMEFIFDDKGMFWGEGGIFPEDLVGTCFEATPSNMVNVDGVDVSAWLGGTHAFSYEPSNNRVTLTGLGAWIGLIKTGTNSEVTTPQNSVSFTINIEEHDGYDLMTILFDYNDLVWEFSYASYSNPALEPQVEEDEQPWGENLDNITPNEIFVTFAARDAENMATIDTITSGSTVIFGVDDPTDASAQKVGQFIRTAGVQWQELQFRVVPEPKDIQFDNFTTAKIDIYVPANTDFTTLRRHVVFGFADMSATQEWWNSPVQFFLEDDEVVLGEWTTYEFDLTDVKDREDLDMIYLGIGGGGHEAGGNFYVRNLVFD